jgi:hypothetical protein
VSEPLVPAQDNPPVVVTLTVADWLALPPVPVQVNV